MPLLEIPAFFHGFCCGLPIGLLYFFQSLGIWSGKKSIWSESRLRVEKTTSLTTEAFASLQMRLSASRKRKGFRFCDTGTPSQMGWRQTTTSSNGRKTAHFLAKQEICLRMHPDCGSRFWWPYLGSEVENAAATSDRWESPGKVLNQWRSSSHGHFVIWNVFCPLKLEASKVSGPWISFFASGIVINLLFSANACWWVLIPNYGFQLDILNENRYSLNQRRAIFSVPKLGIQGWNMKLYIWGQS